MDKTIEVLSFKAFTKEEINLLECNFEQENYNNKYVEFPAGEFPTDLYYFHEDDNVYKSL